MAEKIKEYIGRGLGLCKSSLTVTNRRHRRASPVYTQYCSRVPSPTVATEHRKNRDVRAQCRQAWQLGNERAGWVLQERRGSGGSLEQEVP